MAYTDAKGFRFRQNLYGLEHPATLRFIVANSQAVRIGDLVRLNNAGVARRVGVGSPILGRVAAIVDKNGINIFKTIGAPSVTGTKSGDDTYTAASDNQTVDLVKVEVEVDPIGANLYYNDADGTLATTNLLQLFDVDASGQQVTQGSASDTSGQVQLVAIDPDGDGDASKGLFRIAEPQVISQVGNSTEIVSA